MRFDHKFTVPVPPSEAWPVLVDVERVVPCLPGATLTEVTGRDVRGKLRVRVGPVTVTYQGTARFTERDEQSHRAVITGRAKEARGGGTAKVTITAQLHEQDGHTEVAVRTELALTGRLAQSGRAALDDAGSRLVRRFAGHLAELIAAGPAPGQDAAGADGTAADPGSADPGSAGATDAGAVDPAADAVAEPVLEPVAAPAVQPAPTPAGAPPARVAGTIAASLADEPPGLFPERRGAARRAVPALAVLLLLVLLIRRRRSRS